MRPGKEVREGMEGTRETGDNDVGGEMQVMDVLEGPTETEVMEVGNGEETGMEKKVEVENPQQEL